jgi:hypothetical protein
MDCGFRNQELVMTLAQAAGPALANITKPVRSWLEGSK